MMDLAHLLLQTARRFPDRPGLIRHGRETSWRTLATRVQSAAASLAERGIRHGDRILVRRSAHCVRFLHPRGWNYFATLRKKLRWNEGGS